MSLTLMLVELFLADPPDVRDVMLFGNCPMPGGIVVGFVQAQVLRRLGRRCWPINDDRRDGLSATWCHARLLQPQPRPAGRHRLRRSRRVYCRSSRDPWGCGRHDPPKTRLAHAAVGALPSPIDAAEFRAAFDQRGPDAFQHALVHPTLEGAMNRSIVTELLGQDVPLETAAHLVDNAVERRPHLQ